MSGSFHAKYHTGNVTQYPLDNLDQWLPIAHCNVKPQTPRISRRRSQVYICRVGRGTSPRSLSFNTANTPVLPTAYTRLQTTFWNVPRETTAAAPVPLHQTPEKLHRAAANMSTTWSPFPAMFHTPGAAADLSRSGVRDPGSAGRLIRGEPGRYRAAGEPHHPPSPPLRRWRGRGRGQTDRCRRPGRVSPHGAAEAVTAHLPPAARGPAVLPAPVAAPRIFPSGGKLGVT